jgi:hypothetical protein
MNGSSESEERDSTALRIAKFFAIIVVLAVICGVISAGAYFLMQYRTAKRSLSDPNRQQAHNDPMPALKAWFFLGAGVGAGVGLTYTGRCIVRNEDP